MSNPIERDEARPGVRAVLTIWALWAALVITMMVWSAAQLYMTEATEASSAFEFVEEPAVESMTLTDASREPAAPRP
jgi:hypothetical protein